MSLLYPISGFNVLFCKILCTVILKDNNSYVLLAFIILRIVVFHSKLDVFQHRLIGLAFTTKHDLVLVSKNN